MRRIILPSFFLIFISCSPATGPHKPLPSAPVVPQAGKSAVDYDQVRPIFAAHCSSCHPSRSAPNWLNYSSAINYVQNGMLNQRVVVDHSMPPPGSREAALLSDSDRDLIAQWIQDGGIEKAQDVVIPSAQTNAVPSAAQSCLDCHGVDGPQISSRHDIPKLGGQNAAYLRKQLLDFKWFDRTDPSYEMNKQALEMSDEDISKMADYFAQSKDMADSNVDELSEKQRDSFELGKTIALNACISCHMNSANNFRPINETVPVLCGQTEQYLTNQLIYFQRGMRKNAFMESISKDLTREEIIALSVYFSNINPKPFLQSQQESEN